MMVATAEGLRVAFAGGFILGGFSWALAGALLRAWDKWRRKDIDPLDDPRNWRD